MPVKWQQTAAAGSLSGQQKQAEWQHTSILKLISSVPVTLEEALIDGMVQGLTFVPVLKHLQLHSKRKTQRKSCFTTKLFLKYETERWGQIVCIYFRTLKIALRVIDNSPEKSFVLTLFSKKG